MAKKAILFARVSSNQQTYERQKSDLIPLIKSDNYKDDEIAIIQHKESATKNDIQSRKSISELKELIANNPIEAVYVSEISRLSRRNDVLYNVLALLNEQKICLVIQHPMLIRTIENGRQNHIADVIISFMSYLAVSEVELKLERQMSGYKQAIKEGKIATSIVKYGYNRTKDNKAEVNVEQASIINKIFNMYLEGNSTASIWQYFKHSGVFDDRDGYWAKARKDDKAGATSIWYILNDRTYIGDNGHFYYPAIIDVDLFNKVSERLKSNKLCKTKLKFVYYCQGLIKWNGRTLTPSSSKACYTLEVDKKKHSININVMDSLAKNLACIALSSMDMNKYKERQRNALREAKNGQIKLVNIDKAIEEKNKELERVNMMYQKGRYSDEKYDYEVTKIDEEILHLKSEKEQITKTIAEMQMIAQGDNVVLKETKMYYNLMDVTDDHQIQAYIREAIECFTLKRLDNGWEIRVEYRDKSLNIPEEYWKYIQSGAKIWLYHCSDGDPVVEDWTGSWDIRILSLAQRNRKTKKESN